MTTSAAATPTAPAPTRSPGASDHRTRLVTVVLFAVLLLVVLLSLAVGSRTLSLEQVWGGLWTPDGSDASAIVQTIRIPRTILGVLVGLALGLAGALMQSVTRNPLAEPGLLGVNAGAATAVVIAIGVLGLRSVVGYMWFALLGAAIASVLVYLLGASGSSIASPVHLALAGAAITSALASVLQALILLAPETFDRYRQWVTGSLTGRGLDVAWPLVGLVVAGAAIALALARSLNAVALGDASARALGANVTRVRILSGLSVTLLAGAATAAAGPIAFVGLAVPHMARLVGGPDNQRILLLSTLLGPILVLAADIIGRVVVAPGEVGVGIVTAFLGAPVFIALVRGRRVAEL